MSGKKRNKDAAPAAKPKNTTPHAKKPHPKEIHRAKEINGPKGPEPTRYGDWERKGIVSDF